MISSAAAAVSASRSHVLEAQRVVPDKAVLEEEAKRLREKRLALEDVIRKERNRRLQEAALRRTTKANPGHPSGLPAPTRVRQKGETFDSNTAPNTLKDYRRELQQDIDSQETFRRNYYTQRHLNPVDVPLDSVSSKAREYQRHAPIPLWSTGALSSLSPAHKSFSGTGVMQSSTVTPPSAPVMESTSNQSTRTALFRMQSTQRSLRRVEEREKNEAVHPRWASQSRMAVHASGLDTSQPAYTPPTTTGAIESFPSHHTGVAMPLQDMPGNVAVERSKERATSTQRWGPLRQRSPPRPYFADSPLRVRGNAVLMNSAKHNSLFKPTLKYGSSSSLGATRTDALSPTSARQTWRSVNTWKPLDHRWAAYSGRNRTSGAHQFAAEHLATIPQESQRTWMNLTQWLSSPKQRATTLSSSLDGSAFRADVVRDKSEVQVSPLTPSPKPQTVPHSGGSASKAGEATAGDQAAVSTTSEAKTTLLGGFRMPTTELKREDLFQGFS
ncbi:hypothetical protein JKF63_01981 [Porcisia hertigi]|uniref:Uncharacterized protein n=1 Tax=Porcisia hertigi TaxID=2761500 RepID=A0A836HJ51_9TRYP|nr:hypothetical protein JKF63_01981 [Porcisia hertigi]